MTQGVVTASYIVSAIFFILSLSGLSHPETSRRGNLFGIIGMTIAIAATVMSAQVTAYSILIVTMLLAAAVGTIVAKKVQMTEMPELVAILHSFVGMAAVLIGFASFLEGTDYIGAEKVIHDVEIYLGILIGAVTFTGSVVAFGKLKGIIDGKPFLIPGRHWFNLALGLISFVILIKFVSSANHSEGLMLLLIMTLIAFIFSAHGYGYWWSGYACRCLNVE